MFRSVRTLLLLGISCHFAAMVGSARGDGGTFFLRDGDRVVFLGDSITQQRQYTNLIEAFVLTRFPDWRISFRNAGWGGDTAEGALKRLERDVLALNPSVVTINFGMNDGGYRLPDPVRLNWYETNMAGLVAKLKAREVRIALFAAGAVDRSRRRDSFDYNDTLRNFRDAVAELASKEQLVFADQFSPLQEVLNAVKLLEGPEEGKVLIPDSVHPNWGGHLVMAAADLIALDAPAATAAATIAIQSGQVESARCRIGDVKIDGETLTFTRTDEVHPMPLPDAPEIPNTLRVTQALERLSRSMLSVKGLKASRAELFIDERRAGSFSAKEWEMGINLTALPSAVSADARAMLDAVGKKNDLYFRRWREVQLWTLPDWLKDTQDAVESCRQAKLAEMDQEIEAAERAIDALRRPKAHSYRIIPIEPASAPAGG